MEYNPQSVSKTTRILFPIIVTAIAGVAAPQSAVLVGFLMFGNLLRECGVLDNLSDAAQNILAKLITLVLGLTVAARMQAAEFLTVQTLMILGLGLVAFVFDTFGGVLRNALDEECSLAVVQQVRQELKDRIDAWQETKSDDLLVVSGDELKDVLESCGVSEDKRMQFGAQFDESFGGGAVLNPRNLIDVKKCVLKTPDVSITVNPERPDLVETRTIGGVRYLLIKADEGVELNGIDLVEDA